MSGMELRFRHENVGDLRWMPVGFVGYSCISGFIICVVGCMGAFRAKSSGVDLHAR